MFRVHTATGGARLSMIIRSAKDLTVYQRAYELSMRIFRISQRFPAEERFALTSQIRRSSRSVCLNLREAWAKRRYPAHFVSKLSDSDGENSETDTSLDFAKDCGYLTPTEHTELTNSCAEIGRMLGSMMRDPDAFLPNPQREVRTQPSRSAATPRSRRSTDL